MLAMQRKSGDRPRGLRRAFLPLMAALAGLMTILSFTVQAFALPAEPLTVVRPPRAGARTYGQSPIARAAGERAAFIAVVDVQVKPGMEQAFLEASLENARKSAREPANQRFDVLQGEEDKSRFVLVEIYRGAQGPIDHKATEHYNTWRETVADMMAAPRQAEQWDTVFPMYASGYAPSALVLERGVPENFFVVHTYLDVRAGDEQEFRDVTVKMARKSLEEVGVLRFDILQDVEDEGRFLFIEVYRERAAWKGHASSDHAWVWQQAAAPLVKSKRISKTYTTHFPSVPAAWKVDKNVA